jgi:phospholipid/cholesterol/gamma-HCH transport system substrate-binding protein
MHLGGIRMKRYAMETVVGFFVVIGIICLGYMTIKLGKVNVLGDDDYRLFARFTSVSGLRTGSPVEIYGIEAGIVERLSIDENKSMAVVEMKLKRGMKVFDDGSAAIKTSGLIGDKYVKIDPGGAGELLPPGSWITDTSAPLDIEDIVGKFAFGDVTKKPDTDQMIK